MGDGGNPHDLADIRAGKVVHSDESRMSNWPRIVQCVNACAGIEDPAASIAQMREALNIALCQLNDWEPVAESYFPDKQEALDETLKLIRAALNSPQ